MLIFTAVIINYIDRVAFSVAAKPIVAEFGFSPIQMGYLFSGFLWTYVVCLIPLGVLVERVGAKRMVGSGIAIWSAATMATAAMGGFVSILGARLVMGASEATTYPACGRVIREWFPQRERGLVTTLFNGGSTAGPAIGALIAAALVSNFGWQTMFIVLGLLGFVWLSAWQIWYGVPEAVSWLPDAEKAMIIAERNGTDAGALADAPAPSSVGYLLSQRSVWGLVITQACLVYTAYLFLTWLPSYLQSARDLSTMNTGYLTAIPYLIATALGLAIARFSDRFLSSAAVQAGQRRRVIAILGLLSRALLLGPRASGGLQLMIILTLVLTGANTASGLNFTLASDLLRNPRDVSRVVAITALGGNSFGLIAPIITGYVVAGTGGYDWAFRVAAALLVVGAVVTMTLTRNPIQPQHR